MVSRDHAVCLAAEHAERRRSPSTTEVGDAAAEGAKSEWNNLEQRFFDGTRTVSVLNLGLTATPCSEVIWLE